MMNISLNTEYFGSRDIETCEQDSENIRTARKPINHKFRISVSIFPIKTDITV